MLTLNGYLQIRPKSPKSESGYEEGYSRGAIDFRLRNFLPYLPLQPLITSAILIQ